MSDVALLVIACVRLDQSANAGIDGIEDANQYLTLKITILLQKYFIAI